MVREIGIEVVADVESIAILDKLRDIGVDYAQGHGVSEPIWLDESRDLSSLAETRLRKLSVA